MSYPPPNFQPSAEPTFAPPPPPPTKSRAIPWLIAAVVALVLAVLGLAVALAGGLPFGGGLTAEGAERACRTALGSEWDSRVKMASGGGTDIVTSLQSIELQETAEEGDGYTVNGTVHYTMTTGLISPIQDTLDLTCTVTGTDDSPSTEVGNRR